MVPLVALGVAACAAPEPVVYSADPARPADRAAIERNIAECRALAEAAGAQPTKSKSGETARSVATAGAVGAAAGAVGGAIAGSAGTGAAIGAASAASAQALRSALKPVEPSPAYKAFVERCLTDRGYQVVGWE